MFEFTVKSVIREAFSNFCGLLPLADSFDRVTGNMRTETEGDGTKVSSCTQTGNARILMVCI